MTTARSTYDDLERTSPAKEKLIIKIKKRNPNFSEKDVLSILNGIKRFVDLTRKIYTEPQARITYKDVRVKGKIVKDPTYHTDIEEVAKVMEKPAEPIREVMKKFYKSVKKQK